MDAIDSAMSAEQFQKAIERMHHSPRILGLSSAQAACAVR